MITKETGGPAFPFSHGRKDQATFCDGMTLRDYFAAKAMQKLDHDADRFWLATRAYEIADAMLEARGK